MNKDINDVTLKDIFQCISIINGLSNNGIITIDIEKQAAVFCFDEVSKFLEKQNLDLKNKNKELEKQLQQKDVTINNVIKRIEEHMNYNCGMNCSDMTTILDVLRGEE